MMVEILKMDIKNNKTTLIVFLLLILSFSLCLYLGFYKVHFFNDILETKRLNSQSTNFLKWIELIYPLIGTSFIIKFFSDTHSKKSIGFSLSLPISNFKFFVGRIFLWNIMFLLCFYPSVRFFEAFVIKELGYEYLPVFGFHIYTFINMFVLSNYVLFIQILFGEYYYAFGFLFIYVLFDYFSDGRFLKAFTLYPLSFKSFTKFEFIQNRLTVLLIAFALMIVVYIMFEKSNMFRKNI